MQIFDSDGNRTEEQLSIRELLEVLLGPEGRRRLAFRNLPNAELIRLPKIPESVEEMVKLSPNIFDPGTIIVGTGLIGKKRKR